MISMERFGSTWWGRLWTRALEELSDDFENRLPRGKKYAEEGAVSHFQVRPGQIEARVHGRKTYTVTLALPALSEQQWQRALELLAKESRFVASLLAGEMPEGLDETFREAGASLYPRVPKELQTHCDCPDLANPCKHVAAVCDVMAEALDRDPWLLFDLRGKTKNEVHLALQAAVDSAAIEPSKRRGRPKKNDLPLEEKLASQAPPPSSWQAMTSDQFVDFSAPLPTVSIPRAIPADPSVFSQLGPLPHARIEASLSLAALMHRTAEWIQQGIVSGRSDENLESNGPGESEKIVKEASPFDSPTPIIRAGNQRPWRGKRRRWRKT